MNARKARQVGLFIVLIYNVISTLLHYTDNALFVDRYPEPAWVTATGIVSTLILMTPIGLLGYWLYIQEKFWLAYLCLGFYAITGLSSPVHYLFPNAALMSAKMHLLIWSDAIAGLSLISFIAWSSLILQEWRKSAVRHRSTL